MAMTPMFNPKQLAKERTDALKERFERALLLVLNQLGMELVAYARLRHSYTDRTGNLTNSFGYVILKGNVITNHGGEQGDGEGMQAALNAYSEIAKHTNYNYGLVVVAGMNYAAYVEAKGYNVLLPAELKAKAEFATRMKELISKYDAKLKQMLQ